MKRFVEDDIELSFNSPVRFVQSVACMLLTAPYKLIMTISAKVLYLPKASILKVLLNSIIISGLITVINIAFQLYVGRFSLFHGKLPVIVMVVTTLLLIGCYFVISMVDLNMYTQLADIFPEDAIDDDESMETNEAAKEPEVKPTSDDEKESVEKCAKTSGDTPEPADKPENEAAEYSYEPAVTPVVLQKVHNNIGRRMEGDEYSKFVEGLASLTDPSRFISENLLAQYTDSHIIEDEINLEVLNVGIIPNDFKALA